MVTTREWWRQGLRAWSASALVPVAVLIAVAVLAIGGGVGGVRRLGQLFSGPTVPSRLQAASKVDVRTERHVALPHVPARIVAGAGPAARTVRATPVHRAVRHQTGRSGAGGGSPPPTPTAHRSPGSAKPVGSTPPPKPVSTTPPPTPPPPPAPPKTITRRVGDAVNSVVAPVPIVGPTAARAINSVVTTVDRVLPLPPPSQVLGGLLKSPSG
jgi:hypothetical protein